MKLFKNKRVQSIFVLLMWLSFVLFIIVDSLGLVGSDIGIQQTLETSSFARGMFMDIGVLSTTLAGWMVLYTKYRVRWITATLTLFLGGLVAMPYISWVLWNEEK